MTSKMKAFAEEYVKNGYNGSKAYKIAYEQDNSKVCASEAYKMLRDQRIQDAINTAELDFRLIGQLEGIDKKSIVKALARMLNAKKNIYNKSGDLVEAIDDNIAVNNAINTFAKLTGDFTEKKKIEIIDDNQTNIDPTKLTEEDRERIKKEILANL